MAGNTAWGIGVREWEKFKKKTGMYTLEKKRFRKLQLQRLFPLSSDDLLPRVVDLALSSSDRQTKVAASELLHSTIIVMIGIGNTDKFSVA